MTDDDRRHIETVRKLYSGDEAERASIAQDIVWHVPGHNPISGEYRGYSEYTQLMPSRMAPLTRWDFTLDQVMVNGNFVMATFRVQGQRIGKKVDIQGGHLMRIDTQGKIAEGWGFTADQDALDDFFS